jgi:regulator of replication initiation timing
MISADSSAQSTQEYDAFSSTYDYARLEHVVSELLVEHRRIRSENAALRQELAERDALMVVLDQKVSQQEHRRTDALKRVDDLIAQVEGFATLASHSAGS